MKKILINVFIVINLMMMIRAQLPENAPVIDFVYKPATLVQNYFSMWRGWSMFAPNPLRTNQYIDAKVEFTDGNIVVWNFPRPSSNELFDRYFFGERFRKYTSDALRLDSKKFLWEDGAKFVAKKIKEEFPAADIKSIALRRRWLNIPNWDDVFIPHLKEDNIQYNTYEYYTYKVQK